VVFTAIRQPTLDDPERGADGRVFRRRRPTAIDLLPAAEELQRETSLLHIPVRIAVPEFRGDDAGGRLTLRGGRRTPAGELYRLR
jgi:hypothetical protein